MRCQITEHFDCHLRKPSAFGQPTLSHGQRSRKRTRTSLRMTNDNGQENDGNSYDKGRRKNIGRRRAAKLSVWENMVDKILLADDPSVDSEFPGPILLSLLAVVTVASPLLQDISSRVLFIALFSLFSLLGSYSSDLIDEDDGRFKVYYLSSSYLGSLLLANLMKPFDFETGGVMTTTQSYAWPATIGLIALLVIISNSDFIQLQKLFPNDMIDSQDDDVGDWNDQNYGSAERKLMDMWDQKLEKDESSGDNR